MMLKREEERERKGEEKEMGIEEREREREREKERERGGGRGGERKRKSDGGKKRKVYIHVYIRVLPTYVGGIIHEIVRNIHTCTFNYTYRRVYNYSLERYTILLKDRCAHNIQKQCNHIARPGNNIRTDQGGTQGSWWG